MARRTLFIALVLVLTQLATGCCWKKGSIRERRAAKGACCGPIAASCSCGYPVNSAPIMVPSGAESIPAPQKMPTSTVNPVPTLTSRPVGLIK